MKIHTQEIDKAQIHEQAPKGFQLFCLVHLGCANVCENSILGQEGLLQTITANQITNMRDVNAPPPITTCQALAFSSLFRLSIQISFVRSAQIDVDKTYPKIRLTTFNHDE